MTFREPTSGKSIVTQFEREFALEILKSDRAADYDLDVRTRSCCTRYTGTLGILVRELSKLLQR